VREAARRHLTILVAPTSSAALPLRLPQVNYAEFARILDADSVLRMKNTLRAAGGKHGVANTSNRTLAAGQADFVRPGVTAKDLKAAAAMVRLAIGSSALASSLSLHGLLDGCASGVPTVHVDIGMDALTCTCVHRHGHGHADMDVSTCA
jgi:hypothetical protein